MAFWLFFLSLISKHDAIFIHDHCPHFKTLLSCQLRLDFANSSQHHLNICDFIPNLENSRTTTTNKQTNSCVLTMKLLCPPS